MEMFRKVLQRQNNMRLAKQKTAQWLASHGSLHAAGVL